MTPKQEAEAQLGPFTGNEAALVSAALCLALIMGEDQESTRDAVVLIMQIRTILGPTRCMKLLEMIQAFAETESYGSGYERRN